MGRYVTNPNPDDQVAPLTLTKAFSNVECFAPSGYERKTFPFRDYPLKHVMDPPEYYNSGITMRLLEMKASAKKDYSLSEEELCESLGLSHNTLNRYIREPYRFPCTPLTALCAMTGRDFDWIRWGVTHPKGASGEGEISAADLATMYECLSEDDKKSISRIIRPMYWDSFR
jgi:hypothetical protein